MADEDYEEGLQQVVESYRDDDKDEEVLHPFRRCDSVQGNRE